MLQTENLRYKTVVITGASSGIGHGAAVAFAKEGANLVLAARNKEALYAVAEECKKFGVKALVVVTDVTDPEAVQYLADKAYREYGRIDVWVNDAGVGAVGTYEEVPFESHKQVVAVNLVGYMNGIHTVLPYFKKQKFGTIINMNSLGAYFPSPYAASYTASKYGLRGFTEAVRAELRKWPDIHVCDVVPAFVNSPGMKHGANYTGVEMKPVPPAVRAHTVARKIVAVAKNPKPTTMVGLTAKLGRIIGPHAPALFAGFMAGLMEKHIQNGKKTEITDGNLFKPTPKSSAQIEGSYHRVAKTTAVVGGIATIGLLAWKFSQHHQTENRIQ
ncbi:MAG: SDR family oxidoreductase [Rhizobacter sp.]|nr:SDR family oxidoreductase [Bacteriovorax sp.]